ncbi:MAG: GTPase Era [Pseudomonadota bacterium]
MYCGTVSLIGRSNSGKSTLFNNLVGEHLSTVTYKPQTTRHKIKGILTEGDTQFIFVDSPGMHINCSRGINKVLNQNAIDAIEGVDLLVFLIEVSKWSSIEENILELIRRSGLPCIACINKIDLCDKKDSLLPEVKVISEKYNFNEIVPICAKDSNDGARLKKILKSCLPKRDFLFPASQLSDKNEQFFIEEIIRENVFYNLYKELPYSAHIEVEQIREDNNLVSISAIIYVERPSQRAIVIGNNGKTLKHIGQSSRKSIESLLKKKIYLKLWVKVKVAWQEDKKILASYRTS